MPPLPADVPYADGEDVRSRLLLEANGFEVAPDGVAAALDAPVSAIRVAAAHVAGELGLRSAIARLRDLAHGSGDSIRTESAYALARLGDPEGAALLRDCLELPVDAYVCAPQAAGYLARLGDPSGLDAVERALESDNVVIRIVGSKQLYFFAGIEGVDVFPLFRRALDDSAPDVRSTALRQLQDLPQDEARDLLGEPR